MGRVRYISDEEVNELNKMIAQIMEDKQVENEEKRSSFIIVSDSCELSDEDREDELLQNRISGAMDEVWVAVMNIFDEHTARFGRELLGAHWGDNGIEVFRVED